FGQFAEQSNVGPHTLEQFRADLGRIVTIYPNRPVYPLFVELRALRNRVFELLEGRQHPEQSRELYLVAGALCGVLANASFDLGWLPAAETQARTAFLCAELAGNNALRAWIRGMQSLVAYWDERPRDAVELAADGWRYVPETGTARVRLASIEARAHARLRDQRATENALARAGQARDEVRGADDPGGLLTFPLAKQSFYAATTRLWLGGKDSHTDAQRDAAHAVELYEADPPEQRRLGELCLARLDLAAARLGRDDLDGAAEQLQDVLAIATKRRTDSVARRLNQVGRGLRRPKYQTCALALDLHDQIRGFTRASAPPALPGAGG
ncbi:MAG TPA: XRE family transcriptional regulator, partial [Pseudonocardiaceae bacterium]|nr:XRE family transcriptional regulator [Pseudonocardiaceae bacterium]